MENVQRLVKEANRSIQTADHLAYVTYPLVKEMKLLLTIAENVYVSMMCAMEALLEYDYNYRRISYIPQDFQQKYEIFKKASVKYNINRLQINTITDLKSMLELHKKAPMVFTREEKLIIASQGYRIMKTLNIDQVKQYIIQAKPFVEKVIILTTQNDRRLA